MRRRLAHGAVAVFAAALSLAAPAAAEETKVMQGLDLSLYGTEDQGNASSPFARLQVPADWALSTALYADYTLRFRTDAGVSGQVIASVQGATSTSLTPALDQAWIKASFGEGWGLAFGRRALNDWNDGGYWHPSDVVNNYLAWGARGQAPGADSVELIGLVPFTDFNIDLNAATVLSGTVADPSDLPLFFTVGSILYPFEIRAKAAFQPGRLPVVGASARYTLQSGSIYADALWLHDEPIAGNFGYGPSSGSWFRYSAGAQWTIDITESRLANSVFIQLEYQRQDDGLDAAQTSSYFDKLAAMPLADPAQQGAYAAATGLWNGRFFSLGKDYLYADVALGEIADTHLSLSVSGLMNVDDLSFALQSSLTWSPRNLFSICLSASNFGSFSRDGAGGEALRLPLSAQYYLAFSRSF
jgi:hypothetical protein